MKFIQGHNRTQIALFPVSLDESIGPDNEVRIIDLFVDSLSLKDYGFRPDHNTISNFRQDNEKAIKKVFRATVQIAKHFDLIGGKLIAGDSTKLRAQNSKKNNFNQAKIDRHLAYIDNKLDEYTRALAESDEDNRQIIQEEIKKQQERKTGYKDMEKKLKESGQPQISLSDPESRQIMIRNNITEVAYNVQTTVDAKNNIPSHSCKFLKVIRQTPVRCQAGATI